MSVFELDIAGYFVNGSSVDDVEFTPQCIKLIKQLVTTNDVVTVVLVGDELLELTKTSSFRDYRKIENALKAALDNAYSEYSADVENNTLSVYAIDSDDNTVELINASGRIIERPSDDSDTISSEDVVDVQASIPTLTNKAYISFINLCNETRQFLEDYGEIGQKRKWMLKKTDANAVAKAIFAPIKAWDAVGTECKMKPDEFELLKTNLVQFSEDNVCADLGEYHWDVVFDWMRERKSKCVRFTGTRDSVVAKIRTTVLDAKSKQRIGIIIVTLSIVVDETTTVSDIVKGQLPVFPSNISFNIIAR